MRTGRDDLGHRSLVRQLSLTVLGLGRALRKGRRRTGANGRGDRMNLLRVYRLDLSAYGRCVLAGVLGAQGLQLRRRYRVSGMLLQQLLLSGKRNCGRRWSEFGNYGAIRKSGRGRGGFAAIAIREHALPLRRYSRRGSDHLGLAHLVGIDSNRNALDRLSRHEGTLRYRNHGAAICVVDVGDVDVSDIDVRNLRVGDVDLADVTLRHMIRGVVRFPRAEGEPTDETAAPTANRDARAKPPTTDESDQRGSIVHTRRNRAGAPAPSVVDISPASVVERREPPRFVIHPTPAPRFDPGPAAVVIGSPTLAGSNDTGPAI